MTQFNDFWNRLPVDLRDKLNSCKQDPKWHPEGSVANHTRLVFIEVEQTTNSDFNMMLAAIFHDLGKIDTEHIVKIVDSDGNTFEKISHIGHEFASLKYIDKYIHLFDDMGTVDKKRVEQIVMLHMKAHLYKSGNLKKPAKRQSFENNPYFKDIMLFNICDENGRGK